MRRRGTAARHGWIAGTAVARPTTAMARRNCDATVHASACGSPSNGWRACDTTAAVACAGTSSVRSTTRQRFGIHFVRIDRLDGRTTRCESESLGGDSRDSARDRDVANTIPRSNPKKFFRSDFHRFRRDSVVTQRVCAHRRRHRVGAALQVANMQESRFLQGFPALSENRR